MWRHHAAGIGREHPALTVPIPHSGCRQSAVIDNNLIGDLDMLTGQRRDGLDQRRDTASAKSATQVAAPTRFLEYGRHWRAEEHEIADLDRTPKRLDAPEPERLARCQVQAITVHICGRRQP